MSANLFYILKFNKPRTGDESFLFLAYRFQFFLGHLGKFGASLVLGLLFLLGNAPEISYAQVVTNITGDGSMGTIVPNGCNVCDITGGTRPNGGPNLFHSFDQFNVGETGIANFLNDGTATTNIISRVTGGDPSSIFGVIQTTGFGEANLFLMNPNGIVFGPNATLNVGGDTHFTTANYIRLVDDVQFTADPGAQVDVLTISPVAAFGFSGPTNPESISINDIDLAVADGKTISLVGGDVTIASSVTASGGQIRIASMTSPGEILHSNFMTGPNSNGESFTAGAVISLGDGTTLDVSGDAAGTVIIRGGELHMVNATISADTGDSNGAETAVDINLMGDMTIQAGTDLNTFEGIPAITARSGGSGNAGKVDIVSRNLDVQVTDDFFYPAVISTVNSGTGGRGGDVNITTGNLNATGDPFGFAFFIDSGKAGDGPGGNITIEADNFQMQDIFLNTGDNFDFDPFDPTGIAGNVTIRADELGLNFSGIMTDSFSANNAGNISIEGRDGDGGDVTLADSQITASGFDQGGEITIDVDSFVATSSLVTSSTEEGSGPAPGITVNAQTIELRDGSQFITSTFGDGDAGPINVTALDHFSIIGSAPFTNRPSGIFSNSFGDFGTLGESGTVTINTPQFTMTGGGRINTVTASSGVGGSVIVISDDIFISGQQAFTPSEQLFGLGNQRASGIYTSTVGDANCGGPCGNAGDITITTNSLTIENGAQLDSGSSSTGDGGTVTANASGQISISGTLDDGTRGGVFSRTIGNDASAGDGGGISLTAGQSVFLNSGATVSASSTGPGTPGNVTIAATAGDVKVNNGNIEASSNSPATGGDITVTAGQNAEFTNNTEVNALNTGTGDAGGILVEAGNTILVDNSTVNVQSAQGNAGDIKFDADFLIHVKNSLISGATGGGPETFGANIDFDPQWIIIENSQILANAFEGQGGNITLTADNGVFIDTSTIIDFSSTFGTSGSLDVQAPIQILSEVITPLPQGTLKVAKMYAARCAAQKGGQFSSFVQGGRDGLPPSPGGFMPSPLQMTVPQTSAGSRPTSTGASGNMVKRLGLDSDTEFVGYNSHAHWLIGDSVQGCAA